VNGAHLDALVALKASYDILIPDLEEHLEQGNRDLLDSRRDDTADFFTAYHTYAEIYAYVQNLTTAYPTISEFIPSIGKSIEQRDIFGISIGSASNPKKKVFVSGGQHAREWVAPATTLYVLTQLLVLYDTDPTVKALVDSTTFDFIPLVNPDGYFFTWTTTSNRLWRKNRRPNAGGSYGVDLNRNWNDHWGGEGSSGTPTSDTYRGTEPFSEPESTAVSKYVLAHGPYLGAIDYHSYSQLILRPYGWTTALPPNDAQAKLVGDTIRDKILAVNNIPYISQPSWQLYYTAGTAQDWYYSEGNVPLSYTIELRDTGTYGFQLPANQILPTGTENWAGFLYFAQNV
jgi:murein tripeptide amidase MpaA